MLIFRGNPICLQNKCHTKPVYMKPSKILPVLIILSFLFLAEIDGQAPYFSQFYANKIYLNSSYTGLEPGWTANINYRNQWFGIPDGNVAFFKDRYQTMNASLEKQLSCLFGADNLNGGLGFSVLKDDVGSAPLSTVGLNLSGSLGLKLNENNELRVGFQFGMNHKKLENDFIIYSDQLDPTEGLLGGAESLNLRTGWYPVIGAGIMHRTSFGNTKDINQLLIYGLSVNNILEPGESLLGEEGEAKLLQRYTFHVGFARTIVPYRGPRSHLTFSPHFKWDIQSDFNVNLQTVGGYLFAKAFYGGAFFQYSLPAGEKVNPPNLTNTLHFRNTKSVLFHWGFDLLTLTDTGIPAQQRRNGWVLGFTYDLNVSGLKTETTYGVAEINMRFNFGANKGKRCGVFGPSDRYAGDCFSF